MDLALLVERTAVVAISRSRQSRRGPARLLERLGPGAAELHDLGAVNEALSGKRHQLWLRLAPSIERVGPLTRTVERVAVVAGRDRIAVNEAGDDRQQLATGGRDH